MKDEDTIISAAKKLIKKLEKIQEKEFNELVADLNLNEKMADWMFDYLYNCEEDVSFDGYLSKYGVSRHE